MEDLKVDVLVAGGGLGGLMAAMRAQAVGARVALLGGTPGASNRVSSFCTALSNLPQDETAGLFNDVFLAGAFLNQPALIAAMVGRIEAETLFLSEIGVPLHRQGDGFARRQAAGSSRPWAVFSLGMVGLETCSVLLQRLRATDNPPVQHLPGALLLDLWVQDGAVAGGLACIPSERRWIQISAPAVVLATGGPGRLFGNTTNPPGCLGIGHALALEAGAPLIDAEFVSFEPFIVAVPAGVRGHDLPTTVLREGARIRNGLGEEFLDTTRVPSKDVICRAMVREVREGRGTPSGAIYYDLRGMAPGAVERYVQIKDVLQALQMPAREAQLEVMPAQHSVVGGIRIDDQAATAVAGLYAVGEAAGGVHGAHRLATCGGTEAIAIGAIAGESAARHARGSAAKTRPWAAAPAPELLGSDLGPEDRHRLERIRTALDRGCGILREAEGLRASLAELRAVRDDLLAEGRLKSFVGRAALVALAIAAPALARRESRGDHFRLDHPLRDDRQWLGNLSVRYDRAAADLELTYEQASIASRTPAPLPTD